MIWKWIRNICCDLFFLELQKERNLDFKKRRNPEKILEWLQNTQRLVYFAPSEKRVKYWRGLGGIGLPPNFL